jgi:hypothetical protein
MLQKPGEQSSFSEGTIQPLRDDQPTISETGGIADLTDERARWDWRSRYPWHVWVCIIFEGVYLILILAGCLWSFYQIALSFHSASPDAAAPQPTLAPSDAISVWMTVALGGACGGSAFALKWLYHSVAHGLVASRSDRLARCRPRPFWGACAVHRTHGGLPSHPYFQSHAV